MSRTSRSVNGWSPPIVSRSPSAIASARGSTGRPQFEGFPVSRIRFLNNDTLRPIADSATVGRFQPSGTIFDRSAGVPLTTIAAVLGHADVSTTAIYATAIGAEARELVSRLWT